MQHNCYDNHCTISRAGRWVRQEREDRDERSLVVVHSKEPNALILNTGQMRNALYLKAFRTPASPLNRMDVVNTSVPIEHALVQKRRLEKAKSSSKGKDKRRQNKPSTLTPDTVRPNSPHSDRQAPGSLEFMQGSSRGL